MPTLTALRHLTLTLCDDGRRTARPIRAGRAIRPDGITPAPRRGQVGFWWGDRHALSPAAG